MGAVVGGVGCDGGGNGTTGVGGRTGGGVGLLTPMGLAVGSGHVEKIMARVSVQICKN